MYWFQLWREFKLSIAEILSVFSEAEVLYSASSVLILNNISENDVLNKAKNLWWTIKIFELALFQDEESILDHIISLSAWVEGKFKYSLNLFWEKNINPENFLKKSKRTLKEKGISARYFNKDSWENLSSAQIIWNSILKKWFDLNIVDLGWIYYFWKTLWVQDIDAYSKRDYGKTRDMDIGMLPPKLAQMMINLAWDDNKSLYDPFCGLWTVLIEWIHMGIKNLFWSDFNPDMVKATKDNLYKLQSNFNFYYEVQLFDARDMWDSDILKKNNISKIVTEGFLWEVMTKKNISIDRINIQRNNLSKLYEKFFSGLNKVWFSWTIVISFPFWELNWKHIYFTEIYDILDKYVNIIPIFPKEFQFKETRSWSLLYKRQSQLVWREIFKLTIKK